MKKPKTRTKAGGSQQAASARRVAFVEAYIGNGGNATEAAKAAGYSPKTAYSQGGRLLKRVEVAKAIAERRAELAETHGLTTDRILRECARIAFYDPRKLFKDDGSMKAVHELDDDTAAALASVEVEEITAGETTIGLTRKVKSWDKNAAIDKAMKHLGLFEQDNRQTRPVTIIANDLDERL